MKKSGLFITAIIGAVALFFYSRANAVKSIKVYFNSLQFGKIKGFSIPDIFAKFRIVNPTNTPLAVRSLAGDLLINGEQFASVQQTENLEIPANNEVIYSVKVTPSAMGIVTTLINMLRRKQKYSVTFTGSLNSSGVVLPISETIYQS
jgi:hypothetical protein